MNFDEIRDEFIEECIQDSFKLGIREAISFLRTLEADKSCIDVISCLEEKYKIIEKELDES